MIRFNCTNCSQKIKVAEVHAGKKGKRPKCKTQLVVPALTTAIPPQACSYTSSSKTKTQPTVTVGLAEHLPRTITPLYADLSLWGLLASNIIVIVWALTAKLSLVELMLVYWMQSIVIGVVWFFKILSLKDFSTEEVTFNGRPVQPTTETKFFTAFFFLVHYGAFHAGYGVFLPGMTDALFAGPMVWMALIFLVNNIFSLLYNRKADVESKPNIGTLMFFPYARIIPMHLTIMFGQIMQGKAPILFFLLLKTMADLAAEAWERRGFAEKTSEEIARSRTKYARFAPAPHRVPLSVRLALVLGTRASSGGWILLGFILAAFAAAEKKDNLSMMLLVLISTLAITGIVSATYEGLKYTWLLKNGNVGLGKIINVEEKISRSSRRTRKKYKIYYEFLAEDGKTYETVVKTCSPTLLMDEEYETLFYKPKNPQRAVLLDYLPARLCEGNNGGLVIGSWAHWLLALAPTTIVIVGLFLYFTFHK